MNITFTPQGWEDYTLWTITDKSILRKINTLIKAISRDPFKGLGKPERLKGNLSGFWSRRINREHRLVYRVKDGNIEIVQCKFHY